MAEPNDWQDVDDWVDAPATVPTGGPRNGRKYIPQATRRRRDASQQLLAEGRAQGDELLGALDFGVNTLINAPADIANSGARLLASAVGRTANTLGFANTWEADARDPSRSFGRFPLLTNQGRQMEERIGSILPEWLGEVDPALFDLANVAGAGAAGTKLLPRTPMRAAEAAVPGAKLLPDAPETPFTPTPAKEVKAIRSAGSVAPIAKAAGFEVTPSTVAASRSVEPRGMAAAMEGPGRNAEASLRNAQQLNRRLADELAIRTDADGRLEPGAFDEARLPAFKVYEEARRFPGTDGPEYAAEVAQAIQGIDVPSEAGQEVARLLQRHQMAGDSAQLVEDLKALRRTASKRREGDTANQVANEAIADVQMAIADALENELGRRAAAAGDAGFQQRLQQARLHLAQLYEAERATSGGYVDAAALARRQGKTGKLTGNLQLGATMGENMPDVFQAPQNAVARATGRVPEAWGARSFLFRLGERLGGGAISRRQMRKFNEQIPVGPNALDEFGILPVRDRGYPSPMGPNAGPQLPPPPPLAPPPTDFSPLMQFEQGAFNRAPDPLEIQPQGLSQVASPDLPPGLSLASPDLEGPLRPRQFATDEELMVALGLEPGDMASFTRELDQAPLFAEMLAEPAPAMPARPRGVSGPRSAQLSDPRVPRGFELMGDDTPPPLAPLLGPSDEFPPGPPTVYRGVPIGADPNTPVNPAGVTHWTPDAAEAPTYGANVGEAVPTDVADLGTIVDLLTSVGLDPATAGQPGVLMEALRRYRAQTQNLPEWASFSYPIEGNPTEYVRFGPLPGQ